MHTTVAVTDRARDATRRRLAWLPIPVFSVLFALAAWFEPELTFEPRFLLPALNLVFVAGVCLLVAALAARGYTAGESSAVLLLGCGTLSLAGGAAVTSAAVLFRLPPDTNVTVYNIAAFLSGSCFLAGAVKVLVDQPEQEALSTRSATTVVVCYGAVAAVIALATIADLDGVLPPFFVAGRGPTVIRQVVLGAAIVMFVLAAAIFRIRGRDAPTSFLDWYSLALLLVAVGLAGVFAERAVGGLLGWTARIAQYVGCTYMFVAVLTLRRGSRSWRISLDRTLRETGQRYQSLVDMCPDAIVVHAEEKYVFANPAAARLFGARSADEVVGRDVLELVHPDFRPLAAGRIRQARGGEVTALQEMQFLRLDGSAIDVEVTGAAVEYRGRPAIQTVVRDVSTRKRAEEALRLQSSMTAELLTAADRQSVFDLLAGRIHSVAGGALVAVSEFDPRGGKVILRSLQCTPAERRQAAAIFGGDPVGLCLELPDETRRRWKAGELALVPGGVHELLFRQVPVATCQRLVRELGLGDVFGMACAYEEDILGSVAIITRGRGMPSSKESIEALVAQGALALKRMRAEEATRETRERFHVLFDSTSDGVWIHTLDGVIREVNDAYCAMSGYTRAELEGLPVSRLEATETPEDIAEHITKVIASGGHDRFESRHRRKDGSTFDVDITALYLAADGRIAVFVRDVTERKRAEAALRDADRRKDEFIAMLSHELRNPLAPIRYALQVIAAAPLPERAAHAFGTVSRQVNHLVRLVDDLLDVSRITRGKIELRRQPVTLASVVDRAVESVGPFVDEARHALSVRLPDEAIWMDVDPDRISQVITNLLTNAAKYTPPGGRITVEADRDGNQAVVRVTDDGIGSPPEALPTLFQMFSQEDRLYRSKEGLGIGLALSKQLIEMHGGTIEAHSAGAGQGAEFVVRLPVTHRVHPPRVDPTPEVPAASRRLKVLVVDDNEDLVEMLSLVVEAAGHEVRKARDGRTAVSVATAYRPDVVLLDLGLPGLSGLDVARELRRHPDTAHARLVAFTGLGQAEDHRRTREAGFDRHLTKPTEPHELERLLAEIAAET